MKIKAVRAIPLFRALTLRCGRGQLAACEVLGEQLIVPLHAASLTSYKWKRNSILLQNYIGIRGSQ